MHAVHWVACVLKKLAGHPPVKLISFLGHMEANVWQRLAEDPHVANLSLPCHCLQRGADVCKRLAAAAELGAS